MISSPEWLHDKQLRLARKNTFDGALVLGTSNFNKSTGRVTKPINPFQKYIDPDTGLIRTDIIRPRNCPVCGEAPGQGLFIKDGFRHVRCPSCDLIYVSLILREDIMVQYWREEIAWMGVLQSGPQVDMDRLKFTYGLDVASSLCGIENPGSLLDVGAGTGTFVRIAKEAGWKTTALEFNIASAESLEREGYRVIVKPLELADLPPASFDLITLWEILEHVAEPQLILRNVSKLLTPSGILLILVPNAGSLVTRILHEKSNTFGGHSHLNHFNVTSLKYLLETNGFEILETETLLTELGTINNYLDYQDPYLGDAKPFFDSLTPEIIHDRLWGSRLLVLSKKKEASKPNEDDFHDSPDSFDPSF